MLYYIFIIYFDGENVEGIWFDNKKLQPLIL